MDAEWVKRARAAAGVSAKEAAVLAGVGIGAWYSWERGSYPVPPLATLAPALLPGAMRMLQESAQAALVKMEAALVKMEPSTWAEGRRELLGLGLSSVGLMDWAPRLPGLSLALAGDVVQLAPPQLWISGWFSAADIWGQTPEARHRKSRRRKAAGSDAQEQLWYGHHEAQHLALGLTARQWSTARGLTYNQALALLELWSSDPALCPAGLSAVKTGKEWRVIDPR
jgi:transcriptional regulator with XRE-family HTH domain